MLDYQNRVVEEQQVLDEKIEKLVSFINGKMWQTLPKDEQARMVLQLTYMRNYSQVLHERIGAWA